MKLGLLSSRPLVAKCIKLKAVYYFGPGGLRAPPVVADGSEAGHCFHPSSILLPSPGESCCTEFSGFGRQHENETEFVKI